MSDQTLRNLPAFEAKDSSKPSLLDLPNLAEAAGDAQTPHTAIAALKAAFEHPAGTQAAETLSPEPETGRMQEAEPERSQPHTAPEELLPAAEPEIHQADSVPLSVEPAPQTEAVLPVDAPEERAPDLDPVITQFQEMIETTRTELHAQNKALMMHCMNELLPALSREFMAEEIARHLPNLIPDKIFGVEINAAPELAEQLEQIFNRQPGLPMNATIQTAQPGQKSEVRLQWGEGGYDFDIEPVLQRCRQRLQASLTE